MTLRNPKFVDSNDGDWQAQGHDSCHADSTEFSEFPEWCIKDPKQIQVLKITPVQCEAPAYVDTQRHRALGICPRVIPSALSRIGPLRCPRKKIMPPASVGTQRHRALGIFHHAIQRGGPLRCPRAGPLRCPRGDQQTPSCTIDKTTAAWQHALRWRVGTPE